MKIDYAIYPTLLDSHWWFRKYPSQEKFDDLIDKINKVKKPQAPEAEKGSVFEEMINDLLKGEKQPFNPNTLVLARNRYEFPLAGVKSVLHELEDSKEQQKYIEAIAPMHGATVKLYGLVDYATDARYKDLKTCELYKKGKYADYHQHKAYSLIAHENGSPIERFDYVVSDFYNTFVEPYVPTPNMFDDVFESCWWLIKFLNENKHLITNPKIFGQ